MEQSSGAPTWPETITVIRHHYYSRKPVFEQASDTYGEWAAFAVVEGRFAYRIGARVGEAAAGQLVVCPPGTAFGRETAGPISFHYFLFSSSQGAGGRDGKARQLASGRLAFRDSARFYSGLASLQEPGQRRHPSARRWQSHVLLDLLRLHAMEAELPPPAGGLAGGDDPLLEEARRQLDRAAELPISIAAVAEAVGLSAVQLSRRFRRAYGLRPSAYVEQQRLDKACRLLTHTTMTIEQIALACGYSSGFYLSRCFARRMGLPPSAYRLQHRV
ncbi:helix-turn-helix transcriptional regulator [Paenibacillus sp. IB182496]|uniref:Helix-turn-helix transcriptional regulator n=1 Tax=Paenibacillus sabuli TaxID=2772509 RepID=A0A927GQ57_9BACL|nr:AraC family transcriptional regulator [Paenibacillus sabuli]MBD2843931.1 helix-turn-helix transcriptional regulator [Paenibacillus sabuli]